MKSTEFFEGSYDGMKGKIQIKLNKRMDKFRVYCIDKSGNTRDFLETDNIDEAMEGYTTLQKLAKL